MIVNLFKQKTPYGSKLPISNGMKRFLIIFTLLIFLSPTAASAQVRGTSYTNVELAALLASLQAQLEALRAEMKVQSVASETEIEVFTPTRKIEPLEVDFYDDEYAAIYRLTNDVDLQLLEGTNRRHYERIWERIVAVMGEDFTSEYVREFRVYDDEDVAHAGFVAVEDGYWVFAVNALDASFGSSDSRELLDRLIVHEFAHIYFEEEGEDVQDDFVDRFWTEEDEEHAVAVREEKDNEERWDLLDEYYDDHNDRFVSSYATSGKFEDVAETFVEFVYEPVPLANSNEIKEKLRFFNRDDDLVDVRTDMRDTLRLF